MSQYLSDEKLGSVKPIEAYESISLCNQTQTGKSSRCRCFVEEGARVVFSDLLAVKGQALEGELGQDTAFYRADATSPSDCEALMNFAVERFGGLDCVVNNAGAGAEGGPIAGISVEGFDRAIALLLRGPFLGK